MASTCLPLCVVLMWIAVNAISGMPEGEAPQWMVELFCGGRNGIAAVPWDCKGYLYCVSNGISAQGRWFNCRDGLHFDQTLSLTSCVPFTRSCHDGHEVASTICPTFPKLKFPHPASCAMFYDCSQVQAMPQFGMKIYENECQPNFMFDSELGDCRTDNLEPKECINKPTSKADYRMQSLNTSQECMGKENGLHPNNKFPIFSPNYIVCQNEALMSTNECVFGRIFDPVAKTCVVDLSASLKMYCQQNPYAVFPDHWNCARYFNCSQTSSYFRNNPQLSECLYPMLYDTTRQGCVMFDQMSTSCGQRFQPINPCDYKIGQCIGRKYCIPCAAKCENMPDGANVFPGLPNTRYHIICRGGRTMEILGCPDGQIYHQNRRNCVVEVDETNVVEPLPQQDTKPLGCQCMDNIDPLTSSLKNLSAIVEEMKRTLLPVAAEPLVAPEPPYDCVSPPPKPDSYVQLKYYEDYVVAQYTCIDGYAHCYDVMQGVCRMDDVWDMSTVQSCHKTVWVDTNTVGLPCTLWTKNALLFRGRALTDRFEVFLTSTNDGAVYLYIEVSPQDASIKAGVSKEDATTIGWSEILKGKMTWVIEINKNIYKIYVNGWHVVNVDRKDPREIATLKISEGFHTEEIRFYPRGLPELRIPLLDYNLALEKTAFASEGHGVSMPESAIDGFSNALWDGKSCWAPKPESENPWWYVDLGKSYLVSYLIITTMDCPQPCPALANFEVFITEEVNPPGEKHTPEEVCFTYEGAVPPAEVTRFDCRQESVGRYVRISAVNGEGEIAFCEIEVYGGLKEGEAWTPFSCPDPPLMQGSSVSLSYNENEAVAKYTCHGSGIMCSGNDVIRCTDQSGWNGVPETCLQTEVEDSELNQFEFCRLTLGSGIAFWMTPLDMDKVKIKIANGDENVFHISLMAPDGIILTDDSSAVMISTDLIKAGEEARVVITALTGFILIEVNGQELTKFPLVGSYVHNANVMTATDEATVHKARFHPAFMTDVIREAVAENLAEHSKFESCKSGRMGNDDQQVLVDLEKQFYVRQVKIDLRRPGGADTNLAFMLDPEGSPGRDAMSSLHSTTDGLLDNNQQASQCFTTASVPSPFWLLDLGAIKTVRSVAIQLPESAKYGDQFLNLIIAIYNNKPQTPTSVIGSTKCVDLKDFTTSDTYVRFPCLQQATGRFVQISKNTGGQNGLMSLCEVEVYESLGFAMDSITVVHLIGSGLGVSHPRWRSVAINKEIKLHDFTVNVYQEDPSVASPMPKLCHHQTGDLPQGAIHTLPCVEGVWGQYVEIRGDVVRDMMDYMTVCNVEVYGDRVSKKRAVEETGWSVADCPHPPIPDGAVVQLSFTSNKAIATYICMEGFARCTENNVLECIDDTGWQGDVDDCRPLTILIEAVPGGISKYGGMCRPALGEAFAVYFTSVEKSFLLKLDSTGGLIELKMDDKTLTVNNFDSDEVNYRIFVENVPVIPHKESRMVVTLLSYAYHFDINGREFYVQHVVPPQIQWIYEVGGVGLQRIEYLTAVDVLHVPNRHNLVLDQHTFGSNPLHDHAVDGDYGTCFKEPNSGPWWMAKMDHGYISFVVTHVLLTTSDGAQGETFTGQFKIEVFGLLPGAEETGGKLCLQYDGLLPSSSTTNLTCHQPVDGSYLRITPTPIKDRVFELCEVEVYGAAVVKADKPRDLALLRPTLPSSGQIAVNGNLMESGEGCWDENHDWWMVQLDDLYYVANVKITSKMFTDDLRDFDIRVFIQQPTDVELNPGQLCLHYDGLFPPGTTSSLKCTDKPIGQFVAIVGLEYGAIDKGLLLCEVVVYGEKAGGDPTNADVNLAFSRPVDISSGDTGAAQLVDGLDTTCWSVEGKDTTQWLELELDDYYIITRVSVLLVDCGAGCSHDWGFQISVFIDTTNSPGAAEPDICAIQNIPSPGGEEITLKCRDRYVGKYLELTTLEPPPIGPLICEFKVFGEKLVNHEWSPSDCPVPPPMPNACVSVCHDLEYPVATYTCSTNYSMCSGSQTLTCKSKAGWEGELGECIRTTWEVHHGQTTIDVKEFKVCYAKLGEGYEVWLTPKADRSHFFLHGRNGLELHLTFEVKDEPISNNGLTSATLGISGIDKEIQIKLFFLTHGLEVVWNGKSVWQFKHFEYLVPRLYKATFLDTNVRMFRPITKYQPRFTRVAKEENLAFKRDVSVSSSMASSSSSYLTDGDTSLDGAKCWIADKNQEQHFVWIDLEAYYFIREVILSTRTKEDCSVCEDNTHDFTIHGLSTSRIDEFAMLCAYYEGGMPLGSVANIQCKDGVYGIYLKISSTFVTGVMDRMTFCEIEVYGDELIEKKWSVRDCPPPPTPDGTQVHLSFSSDTALATYKCREGFSMCMESKPLECSDSTGWQGEIGECVKTTIVVPYGKISDGQYGICPIRLGKGIELSVIPTGQAHIIRLKGMNDVPLEISISNSEVLIDSTSLQSGIPSVKRPNVFNVGKETTLRILFLTEHFLILLDGEFYAYYPHSTPETPLISSVELTTNLRIIQPLERYLEGILRRPVHHNLAKQMSTEVSSADTDAVLAVDGDKDMAKCWVLDAGDLDQWYQIDLDNYYFIRELVIITRDNAAASNPCNGCDGRTHDVAIDVKTHAEDAAPMRCAFYHGAVPDAASTNIRCDEDVWGRYVRLSKLSVHIENDDDRLTFCEVEIYGDEVVHIAKDDTTCAAPDHVTFSDVTPSGTARPVTCDENFQACMDDAVCTEEGVWDTLPVCGRFRWLFPHQPFEEPLLCGEKDVVEFNIIGTPTSETRFTIDFLKQPDVFQVDIRLKFQSDIKAVVTGKKIKGTWLATTEEESVDLFPFQVGQQFKLQIIYHITLDTFEIKASGTMLKRVLGMKQVPDSLFIRNDVQLSLVEMINEIDVGSAPNP